MKSKLGLLYAWFIFTLTFFLPDQKLIMRFRGWLYSFAMPSCGSNFQVSNNTKILGIDKLFVGKDVFLATGCVINTGGEVHLKNGVLIGINSVVVAGNHTMLNGSYRFGVRQLKPIVIGAGSWIGANVTITAGSTVPESSVVAANSVYLSSNDVAGIYAGVPAKLIKLSYDVQKDDIDI